jgi:hypothetical protein
MNLGVACPMSDPNESKKSFKNVPTEIKVDASTLTIIAVVVLFVPLIIAGFIR